MQGKEWRRARYGVYRMTAHFVFVVKYRKKVFNKDILAALKSVFKCVCKNLGCELMEFGGEADHVHLLVALGLKVAMCDLVGRLKGASSYEIRKRFGRQMRDRLWGKHLWSPSYCVVSCGGASLDVVRRYVQNQGRA